MMLKVVCSWMSPGVLSLMSNVSSDCLVCTVVFVPVVLNPHVTVDILRHLIFGGFSLQNERLNSAYHGCPTASGRNEIKSANVYGLGDDGDEKIRSKLHVAKVLGSTVPPIDNV